jgi:hypothetical protein
VTRQVAAQLLLSSFLPLSDAKIGSASARACKESLASGRNVLIGGFAVTRRTSTSAIDTQDTRMFLVYVGNMLGSSAAVV